VGHLEEEDIERLGQLDRVCDHGLEVRGAVRRVEDDELVDVVRVLVRERGRDDASPVMRDDVGLLAAGAELEDDLAHVLVELLGRVVVHAFGLVRVVVPTHVERDDVVLAIGAKGLDLLVPLVPELGEAVDK